MPHKDPIIARQYHANWSLNNKDCILRYRSKYRLEKKKLLSAISKRFYGKHKHYSRDNKRTLRGKLANLYARQLQSSRKRNHPKPSYTSRELVEKFVNNRLYLALFKRWVDSGYNTKLAPSIDRIDNALPYSFKNIRITTWELNNKGKGGDLYV